MTQEQRKKRILAFGEVSGHCHVVTGEVEINEKGQIIVGENSDAVLRHLLEKPWMETEEQVWTVEHTDIKLTPGIYELVQQRVFDPITRLIEFERD